METQSNRSPANTMWFWVDAKQEVSLYWARSLTNWTQVWNWRPRWRWYQISVFPWCFHGVSNGFPWCFRGVSMVFPWCFRGVHLHLQLRVLHRWSFSQSPCFSFTTGGRFNHSLLVLLRPQCDITGLSNTQWCSAQFTEAVVVFMPVKQNVCLTNTS